MLNPYQGFRPDSGNAINLAQLGEQRQQRAQQKELAQADDARAGEYLNLQKSQFDANQANALRDKRMAAYSAFQAAVDSGDTEQAALAANALRMLGVDVQEYGNQAQQSKTAPSPASPSPLGPLAQSSPAAAMAQAQAQAKPPMSAKDARTSKELDALARDAPISTTSFEEAERASRDPMVGLDPVGIARPKASRGQLQGLSSGPLPADPMSQITPIPNAQVDDRPLRERISPIPNYSGPPVDLAQEISNLGHGRPSVLSGSRGAPDGAVPVRTPGPANPGSYEAAMEAAGKLDTPTSWAEQVGPDQWEARGGDEDGNPIEERGPRPGPARTQFIKGHEPAEAGQAAPSQPLIKGYRLTFDGQTIDVDPQAVADRQRNRVANALRPLLENASGPEERRAAATAIQGAVRSVGTLSPQQAIELGLKLYQDPLDRGAKEKRARLIGGKGVDSEGYGGVAGLTEDEKKRTLDTGRYARSLINDEMTRFGVKGIREELAQGEDAISKAKSPDALSQFSSKATLQKMLMKGALSDRDVARLEAAPGQWSRLEQVVNNWTEGGQIPPDVIRQIVAIAQEKNALLRERLDAAGQSAKERVMNDPTLATMATPEEHEDFGNMGYGAATGVFAKRKTQRQQGTKAKGAAPKQAKPKGGANEEARRLLGK